MYGVQTFSLSDSEKRQIEIDETVMSNKDIYDRLQRMFKLLSNDDGKIDKKYIKFLSATILTIGCEFSYMSGKFIYMKMDKDHFNEEAALRLNKFNDEIGYENGSPILYYYGIITTTDDETYVLMGDINLDCKIEDKFNYEQGSRSHIVVLKKYGINPTEAVPFIRTKYRVGNVSCYGKLYAPIGFDIE